MPFPKRTQEQQQAFRAQLMPEIDFWFPHIGPLDCAQLMDFPKKNKADIGVAKHAHHCKSYATSGSNERSNGLLVNTHFHKAIHMAAEEVMREYKLHTKVDPWKTNIDFVFPITQAMVTEAFNMQLIARPYLKNITLANGLGFIESWEGLLFSKCLLPINSTFNREQLPLEQS